MILVTALCPLFAGDGARPKIEILRTGVFHGSQVTAKDGEHWLGLVKTGSKFGWRETTVRVRAAHDEIVDAEGENSGKEVSVAGPPPLFLVRGLGRLVGHKVTPVFQSEEPQEFPKDDSWKLPFGGSTAILRIINRPPDAQYDETRTTFLTLQVGEQIQTLYKWDHGLVDQAAYLHWAGDLDGDGKLDLVMDLSDHYNLSEFTLFLSSGAGSSIVKKVSSFCTSGC